MNNNRGRIVPDSFQKRLERTHQLDVLMDDIDRRSYSLLHLALFIVHEKGVGKSLWLQTLIDAYTSLMKNNREDYLMRLGSLQSQIQ